MGAAGGWAVSSEGACGIPSPWRAVCPSTPRSRGPHRCSSLPKGCFSRPHLITTCFCLTLSVAPGHHPEKAGPSGQQNHGPKRWPYPNAGNLRSSLWQRGLHRSDRVGDLEMGRGVILDCLGGPSVITKVLYLLKNF